MTREELLEVCRRAPAVGQVKHEEFVDYVIVLERRRQVDGHWVTEPAAYMSVDGKLAMANEDHRRQGKKLDFEDPVVLVDTDENLTLMVTVVSEVYGRRHGIATSRRVGGSPIERDFAWEAAETSAVGRALSAMGYGLLPGAGLASAEDMIRAQERPEEREPAAPARLAPVRRIEERLPVRRVSRVSRYQRQKLIEMYAELHGVDATAAAEGVEEMFQDAFGKSVDAATYEEGAQITARLLAQGRARARIEEAS